MAIIQLKNLSQAYQPGQTVIDDLSLDIEKGDFMVFLGPSGCGKTTLLKMINKLIPFEKGQILVDGEDIAHKDSIQLRRSMGYVIQQVGLFPHMTIEKNISYVLSLEKAAPSKQLSRARDLIRLLGFEEEMLGRYPRQLSGGQRQRIGVARALAADPKIILMDEPFGAVDEIARKSLQKEIKDLHAKLKKTILFVTHDVGEALFLATKIVLLGQGKIEQMGTPQELVFQPKTDFVRSFFGSKGFTSLLDPSLMSDVYERIIEGKLSLADFYQSLRA